MTNTSEQGVTSVVFLAMPAQGCSTWQHGGELWRDSRDLHVAYLGTTRLLQLCAPSWQTEDILPPSPSPSGSRHSSPPSPPSPACCIAGRPFRLARPQAAELPSRSFSLRRVGKDCREARRSLSWDYVHFFGGAIRCFSEEHRACRMPLPMLVTTTVTTVNECPSPSNFGPR